MAKKQKKLPKTEIAICYVAEAPDERLKGLIFAQAPAGFQGGPAERGEFLLPGNIRLAVTTITHRGEITPEAVACRRLKYNSKGKVVASDESLHVVLPATPEPELPELPELMESTNGGV